MGPAAILNVVIKADSRKASTTLSKYDSSLKATAKQADMLSREQVKAMDKATKAVDKGTKAQTKDMEKGERSMKKAAKAVVGLVTAYAGIAAIKDSVSETLDLAKATDRLSTITGLSNKTASEWIETAKQRKIDATALNVAFITFAKNLKAANDGTGTQRDLLDSLGLTQKKLQGQNFQQTLLDTADAISALPGGYQKANAMSKLFGRGSQTLASLMSSGSKGIKEQLGLVEKHGAALDKNEVEKMKKVAAAQRELGLVFDGLKDKITFALYDAGVAVGGWVKDIQKGRGKVVHFAKDVIKWLRNAANNAATFVDQFVPLKHAIKTVTDAGAWTAQHPKQFFGAIADGAKTAGKWIGGAGKDVGEFAGGVARWIGDAAHNFETFLSSLLPVKAILAATKGVAYVAFQTFKVFEPSLRAFGKVLKTAVVAGLRVANAVLQAFLKVVGDLGSVIGDVVGIVSNLLRGKWGSAWKSAKQLVVDVWHTIEDVIKGAWSSIRTVISGNLGVLKTMVTSGFGAIRDTMKAIAGTFGDIFSGAWGKIKSTFRTGANAVLGVVHAIADVINVIPGVPDIHVPTLGGGGSDTPAGDHGGSSGVKKARGGFINMGDLNGDSVPAVLERGEYVLNRKAVAAMGKKNLDKLNFEHASRFQQGGAVKGFSLGGDVLSAGESVINKGAGFFIDKLPKPNLPDWMGDLGVYMIDHVTDYIKSGFKSKEFGKFTTGPSVAGARNVPAMGKVLLANGLNKIGAAGIIGNALQESGWDPAAMEPGTHNGGLWGFTSGNKSLASEQAYAAKHGKPWTDVATQTHFMLTTVTGGLKNKLNNAASAADAATTFLTDWEIAAPETANLARRQQGARQALAMGYARGGMAGAREVAAKRQKGAGGGYVWPFQHVNGFSWGRTDMGVDFAGNGPIQAVGDAKILNTGAPGWPGGGGVEYQLLNGPKAGKIIYNWENVAAKVRAGQRVGAGDVIAHLNSGFPNMEFGWGTGVPSEALSSANGTSGSKDSPGGTPEGRNMYGFLKMLEKGGGWSGASGGGGGTDSGPTPKQEAKARKKRRMAELAKRMAAVKKAETTAGKRGALWQTLSYFAKYGIFDKDNRAHFLDGVRGAAGQANPNAVSPKLNTLMEWAADHVDLTGLDDSKFDSLSDAFAKARETGQGVGAKKRKRILSRVKTAGLPTSQQNALKSLDGRIGDLAEWIDITEQSGTSTAGPGGSDLTRGEINRQVDLNTQLLARLVDKRTLIGDISTSLEKHLGEVGTDITKANPPTSKTHWKLKALLSNRDATRTAMGNMAAALEGVEGRTGHGGDIFTTQLKLDELGVTRKSLTSSGGSSLDISGLRSLLEAARYGVFDGMFAKGGRLGAGHWGIAGEAGAEIVHGPATITPMGGGVRVENNVYFDGMDLVVETMIDGKLAKRDRKAALAGRAGA